MLQPVNVDELNQLLAYHEVFGKLQTGQVSVGVETTGEGSTATAGVTVAGASAVVKSVEEEGPNSPPGSHPCDLCHKVFPYRYQMIVHRRYHTERKPYQCQVSPLNCRTVNIVYSDKLEISAKLFCGSHRYSCR